MNLSFSKIYNFFTNKAQNYTRTYSYEDNQGNNAIKKEMEDAIKNAPPLERTDGGFVKSETVTQPIKTAPQEIISEYRRKLLNEGEYVTHVGKENDETLYVEAFSSGEAKALDEIHDKNPEFAQHFEKLFTQLGKHKANAFEEPYNYSDTKKIISESMKYPDELNSVMQILNKKDIVIKKDFLNVLPLMLEFLNRHPDKIDEVENHISGGIAPHCGRPYPHEIKKLFESSDDIDLADKLKNLEYHSSFYRTQTWAKYFNLK